MCEVCAYVRCVCVMCASMCATILNSRQLKNERSKSSWISKSSSPVPEKTRGVLKNIHFCEDPGVWGEVPVLDSLSAGKSARGN